MKYLQCSDYRISLVRRLDNQQYTTDGDLINTENLAENVDMYYNYYYEIMYTIIKSFLIN